MLGYHGAFPKALRARCAAIVLTQLGEHCRAGHPGGHSGVAVTDGQRGPYELRQISPGVDPKRREGQRRNPSEKNQEAENDNDPEPKRWNGEPADGKGAYQIIDPAVLL